MRGERASIFGVPVTVVSDAEAEKADLVVCGPESYFEDDIWTTCAGCKRPICHRPTAPKSPPKVCITCATAMAAQPEGTA